MDVTDPDNIRTQKVSEDVTRKHSRFSGEMIAGPHKYNSLSARVINVFYDSG